MILWGSGGTGAGLALGVAWSGLAASGTELVGLGVDDDPAFFYDKLDGIFATMGLPAADVPAPSAPEAPTPAARAPLAQGKSAAVASRQGSCVVAPRCLRPQIA